MSENNNKNNKRKNPRLCRCCKKVKDFSDCITSKQQWRAEHLDNCLDCQKASFTDWDSTQPTND